jgi:hypothetical protein
MFQTFKCHHLNSTIHKRLIFSSLWLLLLRLVKSFNVFTIDYPLSRKAKLKLFNINNMRSCDSQISITVYGGYRQESHYNNFYAESLLSIRGLSSISYQSKGSCNSPLLLLAESFFYTNNSENTNTKFKIKLDLMWGHNKGLNCIIIIKNANPLNWMFPAKNTFLRFVSKSTFKFHIYFMSDKLRANRITQTF